MNYMPIPLNSLCKYREEFVQNGHLEGDFAYSEFREVPLFILGVDHPEDSHERAARQRSDPTETVPFGEVKSPGRKLLTERGLLRKSRAWKPCSQTLGVELPVCRG